jgi:hypothetical protein
MARTRLLMKIMIFALCCILQGQSDIPVLLFARVGGQVHAGHVEQGASAGDIELSV